MRGTGSGPAAPRVKISLPFSFISRQVPFPWTAMNMVLDGVEGFPDSSSIFQSESESAGFFIHFLRFAISFTILRGLVDG